MTWKTCVLALLMASALALSGCTTDTDTEEDGGDVSEDQSPSPSPTPTNGTDENAGGEGRSADDPASGTFTISMQEFLFDPQEAWVETGTTVRWVNDGAVIHTATADDGSWDTGDVLAGESAEVTFDAAGDHPYHCAYHEVQGMVGTIHVVSAE